MEGFWEGGSFVLRSTIEERARKKDETIESLRQQLAAQKMALDGYVLTKQETDAEIENLSQQLAECERERDRYYAYQRDIASQLATVTAERDELVAVLQKYHKLTAHDGWYADMVKAALAKAELREAGQLGADKTGEES